MDESDETQVLGRDVQRAARQAQASAAQGRAAGHAPAAAPRRETATAVREPEGFFERLSERPGLAAGIAVAVVAVIALIVTGILLATGSSNTEKVTVPNFVGRMIDEVMADPTVTENFTIQEADERVESSRPAGEVLQQDVNETTEVVKGAVITLTVSAGGDEVRNTFKVIDFAGRSLDYVTTMLDEHEITYTTQEVYSDEVEAGLVTSTDPGVGSELEPGASITIYVSKGKENKTAAVPSLYGMTRDGAQQALEAVGLKLGSVNEVENQAEVGTVVWQSTDPNTQVDQGTTINIQISKGITQRPPETSDDENNTDDGGDEPDVPQQGTATRPDRPAGQHGYGACRCIGGRRGAV